MKIAFGCDHAASSIREKIINEINKLGYEVIDFGTKTIDSVDYPDYAKKVVQAVLNKEADKGVLVCGTGIGMSIAANRFPQIRCALCTDLFSAEQSRLHNDANILALRARNQDVNLNLQILKTWLETPFSNEERHIKRIEKLTKINNCQ